MSGPKRKKKGISKGGAGPLALAFALPLFALTVACASSIAIAQSQDDTDTSQSAPQSSTDQKIKKAQQVENGDPCYPGSPLFTSNACLGKAVAAPPIKSPMAKRDADTIAEILKISEKAGDGSGTATAPVEEANTVWPASILPVWLNSENPKASSSQGIQYPLRESDDDGSGTR